jgi:hypothetical protein
VGVQAFDLPVGAELLSVGKQREHLVLWVLCDPDAPGVPRQISGYWTGQPILDPVKKHLGTVDVSGVMYHFFEVIETEI